MFGFLVRHSFGGCAALIHPTVRRLRWRSGSAFLWWMRCAYPPYGSALMSALGFGVLLVDALRLSTLRFGVYVRRSGSAFLWWMALRLSTLRFGAYVGARVRRSCGGWRCAYPPSGSAFMSALGFGVLLVDGAALIHPTGSAFTLALGFGVCRSDKRSAIRHCIVTRHASRHTPMRLREPTRPLPTPCAWRRGVPRCTNRGRRSPR